MKDSQLTELYFVVGSPFRYYMFVLLTMFGGWNIAKDMMNIMEHNLDVKAIAGEYIGITILSMIGFYLVRKNAIRKIKQIESKK
ncbi:MAG: hypothetical protein GXP61_08660 [Epsilonproteobacteria bacterium]|nr:hypothetical protein [Campylobacterota bacterium]